MLISDRIFPWGCASGFLRRIVPDAAPQHGLLNGMPHVQRQQSNSNIKTDVNGATIIDGSNNNSLNNINNNKSASMLIKRSPSTGERVL